MSDEPRFQAEYFIRQNVEELKNYAAVFSTRIANAFADLQEQAERIQQDEYAHLAASGAGPSDDASYNAEVAYFKGVDFYLATEAVRQGIVNLMVAGLFHLFEQQAGSLARELATPAQLPATPFPWDRLRKVLLSYGVQVSGFKSMGLLEQLRLVANAVKHGDGHSAEELRALKPDLFEGNDPTLPNFRTPLRPLVGEGLRLTEGHFNTYTACLEEFWQELTNRLLPVFCPPS